MRLDPNNFGLYSINLLTGAATFVGAIAAEQLYGLAFAPAAALGAVNLVPEPGTLGLLGAAGLAAFCLRRRRAGSAATAAPRSAKPAAP